MSFRWIQTFILDPAAVKGSSECGVTRVNLYFRGKPKATGNKSGIDYPGVEVSLIQVRNGVPVIGEQETIRPTEPTEHGARFAPRFEVARKEYGEVSVSSDGSLATAFIFENPMFVPTGYEYAILVKYDGNEDFVLWYSKKNDTLIGSGKPSGGASDKYTEKLFGYIGSADTTLNTAAPTSTGILQQSSGAQIPNLTPDNDFVSANWKAMTDMALKYDIYVARYFHNGFPVSGNSSIQANPLYAARFQSENTPTEISDGVTRLTAPALPEEYITYQVKDSVVGAIGQGEMFYQVAPYWSGGKQTPLTVSAKAFDTSLGANGLFTQANGSTFASSNGFFNLFGKRANEYVIIDGGASGLNIRQVAGVKDANTITLVQPPDFTNATAKIMIAPVGAIVGIMDTYNDGGVSNMFVLSGSNANNSMRFVNNAINSATIAAGGSGYANSDYIEFTGYESVTNKVLGGYKAVANLTTNSTGGITSTYFSNLGCGFVNAAAVVKTIKNANGGTSTGTGANLQPVFGTTIKNQSQTTSFANCEVKNIESSRLKPEITVNNPLGTAFTAIHRGLFYSKLDSLTHAGKAYFIYDNPAATDITVKIFKSHDVGSEESVASVIPSRSNQFIIPYANGSLGNTSIVGNSGSNAAVYFFDISSNNDYIAPFFEPEIINSHYSKYIINNDYTGEETNYGNAYAKHIVKKITFNVDRQAEDALVYLTAYRPAGTDLKVYARIHNRNDSEAFDDEDWTLLEQIDGIGVYSSGTDPSNFIELTYGFPDSPNTSLTTTITGSVSVANVTTTTITGVNTHFDSQLSVGDMVKITQPLFAANSYAICVVNSITNATSFTMQEPIANVGLVGDGLQIQKIDFKHQAFNNRMNSNVVSYYNEDMARFDTYDTLQCKVVFLSVDESVVPKIDDIRGAGVSA